MILRIEQLCPFPHKALAAEFKKFPNATEIVWCQDEPQNQGAWFYVQHHLLENMGDGQKLAYAGRPASASPAVIRLIRPLTIARRFGDTLDMQFALIVDIAQFGHQRASAQ